MEAIKTNNFELYVDGKKFGEPISEENAVAWLIPGLSIKFEGVNQFGHMHRVENERIIYIDEVKRGAFHLILDNGMIFTLNVKIDSEAHKILREQKRIIKRRLK
jgi:hypothetical protein